MNIANVEFQKGDFKEAIKLLQVIVEHRCATLFQAGLIFPHDIDSNAWSITATIIVTCSTALPKTPSIEDDLDNQALPTYSADDART